MRCVESEMMSNRFGWSNQKNYWCLIAIIVTISACAGTFALLTTLFIYLEPSQYIQVVHPIFQSHRNDEKRLLTVYENQALKNELCTRESNIYAGSALDKDQYCNLKYQPLPLMQRPFDVSIEGLNSETIKFVKICLFKRGIEPEQNNTVLLQDPLVQIQKHNIELNKKYLCQRYRTHQKVHIGNYIELDELFFMIIQLEMNEKGAKVEKIQSKLIFQEEVNFVMAIFIDYYFWIGSLIILAMTAWMTVVACALSCSSYFKLKRKKVREEEELMMLRRCKGQ